MTPRESALFMYLGTIIFEPKVKAAVDRVVRELGSTGSLGALGVAIYACLEADIPAVGKEIGKNGAKIFAAWAKPRIGALLDEGAGWLGDFIEGIGRPTRR